VRVRITISWTWRRGHTRLRRLGFGHLPRRAVATVSCAGRGCPKPRRHAAGAADASRLATALRGTAYRAGDRLEITVTVPGRVPERAALRIRDGAAPVARIVSS
jgi:hypothetical protein